MRIKAVAADYDDTIAQKGKVTDKIKDSLIQFRQTGRKLILITGRILDDLETVFSSVDIFDVIVAENGAVLKIPETGEIIDQSDFKPEGFAEILKERGVGKLTKGRVITATMRMYERAVQEAVRNSSRDLEIIMNKDSLMVLPRGIDKASGLRAAAAHLGVKENECAGIGDAENDIAFLRICGLAGGVSNAIEELKGNVNFTASSPYGNGVLEFLAYISENDR